jgi:hypothetical protein
MTMCDYVSVCKREYVCVCVCVVSCMCVRVCVGVSVFGLGCPCEFQRITVIGNKSRRFFASIYEFAHVRVWYVWECNQWYILIAVFKL